MKNDYKDRINKLMLEAKKLAKAFQDEQAPLTSEDGVEFWEVGGEPGKWKLCGYKFLVDDGVTAAMILVNQHDAVSSYYRRSRFGVEMSKSVVPVTTIFPNDGVVGAAISERTLRQGETICGAVTQMVEHLAHRANIAATASSQDEEAEKRIADLESLVDFLKVV
jgi:hypothetical protein